jgi:hypothetical protein
MSYRGIWINTGTDVQSWQGLKDLGVTHVFYDLHDHSRREFDNARAKGFSVGAYTNPDRFGFGKGATIDERAKSYRTVVSQRLTALSLHDEQCDVQFNIEKGGFVNAGIASILRSDARPRARQRHVRPASLRRQHEPLGQPRHRP